MFSRDSGYQYSNVRMILMKSLSNETSDFSVRYVKGAKGILERDTYMELIDLEKGEYFCFIEVEWEPTTALEDRFFTFNSYGETEV